MKGTIEAEAIHFELQRQGIRRLPAISTSTFTELWDRGIQVNRKVVARLHTSWDLAVIKRIWKPKTSSMAKLLEESGPRVNLVANLSSIDDFEVLYTDFTGQSYPPSIGEAGRKRGYGKLWPFSADPN